ncbi:SMP-30/gluconolactonase/LRE family protein [Aestuariirhabdus sp. LZHN29]|uniref:SMP-30/gluconolactonase/LRE family protein n=1 Tax=Aestuariirhabdus sp. LZHN29 TaxID=3417462 RepID=UPI003CF234AC
MSDLTQLSWHGNHLVRPECVLTTRAGYVYVSDFCGGVTEISPAGVQSFFGGDDVPGYGQLKPNGIALLENGDFLVAHLGDSQGGIFRIARDNTITPFLTEIEGKPLPPSNFVYLDRQGRIWITVSTRHQPRAAAYRSDIADGFIILVDKDGPRIVADHLGYTNELYVDAAGEFLYVNATFSRELLRYRIGPDNSLNDRTCIFRFGAGTFPDGLTQDSNGDFWITSIVSNRVLRVSADGHSEIVIEDVDPDHLEWVEAAFKNNAMGRPHLDNVKSRQLRSISSLAFGGPNLDRIYLGCLLGERIAVLPSGVRGQPPVHWHFDDSR